MHIDILSRNSVERTSFYEWSMWHWRNAYINKNLQRGRAETFNRATKAGLRDVFAWEFAEGYLL